MDTACAADRTPNGSGCGSKPAGAIQYVGGTVNELQFCDSTNWVAMGWAVPAAEADLQMTPMTACMAPEANNWYGITYGNGPFAAVAGNGTNRIMTSPDAGSGRPRRAWKLTVGLG